MCVHASMLPEQSQTHKNREKVASVGALLMIISSIIAVMIPMIIESVIEDPENVHWWQPSGALIIFFIPLIGSIFSFIGLITVILTILSVDESFHKSSDYVLKKKN